MQRALERHKRGEARVVPIVLRPCDWQHSPLKDLQCLPRDGKPVTQWPDQDEVFHAITQGIRRVIEQQQSLARPPVPLSSSDRQSRIRMLRQVRTIWIDGLLTQSLHRAVNIELHLQDRPDVLANPWRLQVQELDQDPQALPDGISIVQVYDQSEEELLILGEPGAGKTTLLLELTRALLERAENDQRLPMPIVFHLSSWAEKRQSLRIWLVEELRTKYQVPRKIGQNWIDDDQVLPLLDGLDEVAKEARSACVDQINDYYQSQLERGKSPIAVCCRSEEYTALSTHLVLQHAVSVLPLTDEQINTYLEQAGEQVRGLKQALNEDAELHNLARQPLMLNIFTFAYRGARASEVPIGATLEEMRRTIFARYVEHMLKRRGQSEHWVPDQIICWLTFLAIQMQLHDQIVFSVENLQPTWLSKGWRFLYRWCIRLVIELLCGLIIGLVAGLSNGGLAFGLVVWVMFILAVRLDTGIYPAEVLAWSWERARFGLAVGLIAVLIIIGALWGVAALLAGSLFLWQQPYRSSLISVLLFGLFFGIAIVLIGLAMGLSGSQLPERLSLSPNEGIWRSAKSGLVVWLVVWLLFVVTMMGWLLSGVIVLLSFGSFHGLVAALLYGLITGLVVGLFYGLGAFVKHFVLRFFLALRGDLPWDLVAFLDEASERLLLRKVGGSYIFVHRMLLDYFVNMKAGATPIDSNKSVNLPEGRVS